MMFARSIAVLSVLVLPLALHAQSLKSLTNDLVAFANTFIVPLFFTLAFLMFMVGMVRFFFLGGEEGREKGKQFMLWSVIGFVVMFSVWGIVNLLLTTFGVRV